MEAYTEIREAVAKLCAGFPGPYWRALDREMAYPTAFVTALTESERRRADWLRSRSGGSCPRGRFRCRASAHACSSSCT